MSRVAARLSRRLSFLVEARPDGQLLAAFLADRDEGAFAELVRRHGPLVWAACRRLLPDPADAEDAFQAAFLVLVQRARRLTGDAAVGPWLYRVAVWTARNVRRRNARALARRKSLPPAVADPAPGPAADDLRADLDAALLALPEKYRAPLVLCHLQGWTRRDAAAAIGCPEGTLSSLLSRGLDRLRHLLRAHDPARLLVPAGLGVPAVLAANTVRAAVDGKVIAAGVVGSSVSQLVEGVVHMFWVKKATATAAALCVVFGTGIGVGVSVRPVPGLAADGDGPVVAAAAPPGVADLIIPAVADLDTLKAELAAAEELVKAAADGVKLTEQKLALTEKGADKGQVALAEVLQDQITLTRFQENLANAKLRRAGVLTRLKAAEQLAKERPAAVAEKRKAAESELTQLREKAEWAEQMAKKKYLSQAQLAADKEKLKRAEEEFQKVYPAAAKPAADLDALKGEAAKAAEAARDARARVKQFEDAVLPVRPGTDPQTVKEFELTRQRFRKQLDDAEDRAFQLTRQYQAAQEKQKTTPDAAKLSAFQDWSAGMPKDALAALQHDAENVTLQAEKLAREMDALKLKQAQLQAEAEQLYARRAAVLQKLAELKQQQDKAPPAAGNKYVDQVNYLFHLTVGEKGAAWPFQVKEYGPGGPAVGTAAFDGPAALARYLKRIAAEPGSKGRGVRIIAPKDAPADLVKQAAEAVKAAGLSTPSVITALDPAKPGATARNFEAELLQQFGRDLAPGGTDEKKREALLLQQFGAKPAADGDDAKKREALLNWLRTNPTAADPAVVKQYLEARDAQIKAAEAKPQADDAAKLRAEIETLQRLIRDLEVRQAAERSKAPPVTSPAPKR